MTDKDSLDIQALVVANDILDAIARLDGRVSAAQIARELDMTPPRVGRYLSTLQTLGLVETLPGERGYALGWKLIRLGQTALDKVDLTEIAHAEADRLRNSIQDGVYVAVPHDSGAVVVIYLRGRTQVSLHLALGRIFLGHASASGRVVMAWAPAAMRERYLAGPLDATAFPDPILERAALDERFALIRRRRYDVAVSAVRQEGDNHQYVAGIAMPIFGLRNEIAGTIGVMSGFVSVDGLQSPEMLDKIRGAAARISRSLGGTLWDDERTGADRRNGQ